MIRSASSLAIPARALSFGFRARLFAAAVLPRAFFETGIVLARFGFAVFRPWTFGLLRTGWVTAAVLLRSFLETGIVLFLWTGRAIFRTGVLVFSFFTVRLRGAVLRRAFFEIEIFLFCLPGRADFAMGDLSPGVFWLGRLTLAVLPAGFFETGFFETGIFFAFRSTFFDLVGACRTRLADGRFGDSLIDDNGLCTACAAMPPVFSTTGAKGGMSRGCYFSETFCSTVACFDTKTSCREL